MALINIDAALNDSIRLIKKAPINGGIEIMSYKRNRTVALIRLSEDTVTVLEKGYLVEENEVKIEQLAKRLKPIFKREFPRSRKVRFFKFKSTSELERIHQKI